MPPVTIAQADLARFGQRWTALGGSLSRTPPESSAQLGELFDKAVAQALATMLGGVDIVKPKGRALIPSQPDCVEQGPVLVIGGVRSQQFDVGYRPDAVRFVFDSKTLNDTDSIGKNWQNMVNDLGTEATTVHSRFPYAVVAFMVILPGPALMSAQESAIIGTLERLSGRFGVGEPAHIAEVISLVVWDPATGMIDPDVPDPSSSLRFEKFSQQVQRAYSSRYQGLRPHVD